jgi:hypothetical protein
MIKRRDLAGDQADDRASLQEMGRAQSPLVVGRIAHLTGTTSVKRQSESSPVGNRSPLTSQIDFPRPREPPNITAAPVPAPPAAGHCGPGAPVRPPSPPPRLKPATGGTRTSKNRGAAGAAGLAAATRSLRNHVAKVNRLIPSRSANLACVRPLAWYAASSFLRSPAAANRRPRPSCFATSKVSTSSGDFIPADYHGATRSARWSVAGRIPTNHLSWVACL